MKKQTAAAISVKANRGKRSSTSRRQLEGDGCSINQGAVLRRDGEQCGDVFTKHHAEPVREFEGLTSLEGLLSSGHAMYREGFASTGRIFGSTKLSLASTSRKTALKVRET